MKRHNIYLSITDDDMDTIYNALTSYMARKPERAEEIDDIIDLLYNAMEDAGAFNGKTVKVDLI